MLLVLGAADRHTAPWNGLTLHCKATGREDREKEARQAAHMSLDCCRLGFQLATTGYLEQLVWWAVSVVRHLKKRTSKDVSQTWERVGCQQQPGCRVTCGWAPCDLWRQACWLTGRGGASRAWLWQGWRAGLCL
jgi:hypothetical protein